MPHDHAKEESAFRVFFLSASLTIGLCLAAVFLGMAIRGRDLINEQTLGEARSLFNAIVMTRKWNARHGGVYVLKREGEVSNPYLVNPDIEDASGQVYTKKNPALMTREISEIAATEGLFKFHITSLKPKNPGNDPDEFERAALAGFETGRTENFTQTSEDGRAVFRYMAPLVTETPCLACHADQGYKLGDVRGGISVSFDVESLDKKLKENVVVIAASSLLTLATLFGLFYSSFRQMRRRLGQIREQLRLMATTDALTGIANRASSLSALKNEFMRFARRDGDLCCAILDLDHFKRINDRFGHPAGDETLKVFASFIQAGVRPYDILGRYGGEEFLLVLPETSLDGAVVLLERLRQTTAETVAGSLSFPLGGALTVSIGVTQARNGDASAEAVLSRADQALYKAKSGGRDQVAVL